MSLALQQILGPAPRPAAGQRVLRLDLSQAGAVLLHDLSQAVPQLHTRFVINSSAAEGGEVTIAGGIDDAGFHAWRIDLDSTTHSVALIVAGQRLDAALPTAIHWHSVEVGLDTQAGRATLRINGIERAAATVALDATRHVWLGSAFADETAAGHLDIDSWITATASIGVPTLEPEFDDAGDPRRWLVVYRSDDADSCAFAEVYRERRGVPYANLCGLDLPSAETLSQAEYAAMLQQINVYLDDNALRSQVVGVLLGYGVPGYADPANQGVLTPIASLLHTDDAHGLPVVNPLYQSDVAERPSSALLVDVRFTGRIDAPSLAEAIALIDRADALADQPITHDAGGRVIVDVNPNDASVGPVYTQPVADWAEGLSLASLRLPTEVYDAEGPSRVSDDAAVWGWRDAEPTTDFFASPAGRRAICVQFATDASPATTLRDASAVDWVNAALRAGYAFAAGPSRAYSLSSLPLPHLFFQMLRKGWTVAEAWLVAQPFLRDGLQLVGDPLASIRFPKAGYDVFGPLDRLDQLDAGAPLAVLHAGQTSLQLQADAQPTSGEPQRYLIRRIDDVGRPDSAAAAVTAVWQAGRVVTPALPAWPMRNDWPTTKRGGRVQLAAYWPASLRSLGIDAVRLVAETAAVSVVIDELHPSAGQRRVVFDVDPPTTPTRYRLAVAQGAAVFETPWSQVVSPVEVPTAPLTLLEKSS
jgi:uncharacterized protein (TIGR03790 family)